MKKNNFSPDVAILLYFLLGFIVISIVIFICGSEFVTDGWLMHSTFRNYNFSDSGSFERFKDIAAITGQKGDAFGGTMGPMIAWLGALLTFLAFWVQFRANRQQRNDTAIERFENRYFELLKLHATNVSEINIGNGISGRQSFVHLFGELKFCYKVCEFFNQNIKYENLEEVDLLSFSFSVFFHGLGEMQEKQYVPNLTKNETKLFKAVKWYITEIIEAVQSENENDPSPRYTFDYPDDTDMKRFLKELDSNSTDEYEGEDDDDDDKYMNDDYPSEDMSLPEVFFHLPFSGYVNYLGHYFRHLYQTSNYIIETDILTYIEKYQNIKTLRAQLSNFEQLLLYYNSMAWFRENWHLAFTQYRLIKNLPLPLADFGPQPEVVFKNEIEQLRENGDEMFELNE